jgi:phenylalanyl-tRNA synthetase beta chain
MGLLWYGKPGMHWRQFEDRDIFRCKGEVSQILNTMGLMKIRFKTDHAQGFETALKIYSEKTQLGILGIPSLDLLNEYDINQAPVICDISMRALRHIWQYRNLSYKAPPQYPSVNRDIALQVSRNVPSEDLFHTIWNEGGDILTDVTLFDVYQAEDVGEENKSLAFSLTFQSKSSTLKDSEVDAVVQAILNSLYKTHEAIQR